MNKENIKMIRNKESSNNIMTIIIYIIHVNIMIIKSKDNLFHFGEMVKSKRNANIKMIRSKDNINIIIKMDNY